ncbi:hypothetical protein BDZ91DRAFT_765775 [Kalaharituber pfeilii]|nr:hypothetical protein BDZ91DRAFT_765775 [Kalaharituber pfeilii]
MVKEGKQSKSGIATGSEASSGQPVKLPAAHIDVATRLLGPGAYTAHYHLPYGLSLETLWQRLHLNTRSDIEKLRFGVLQGEEASSMTDIVPKMGCTQDQVVEVTGLDEAEKFEEIWDKVKVVLRAMENDPTGTGRNTMVVVGVEVHKRPSRTWMAFHYWIIYPNGMKENICGFEKLYWYTAKAFLCCIFVKDLLQLLSTIVVKYNNVQASGNFIYEFLTLGPLQIKNQARRLAMGNINCIGSQDDGSPRYIFTHSASPDPRPRRKLMFVPPNCTAACGVWTSLHKIPFGTHFEEFVKRIGYEYYTPSIRMKVGLLQEKQNISLAEESNTPMTDIVPGMAPIGPITEIKGPSGEGLMELWATIRKTAIEIGKGAGQGILVGVRIENQGDEEQTSGL